MGMETAAIAMATVAAASTVGQMTYQSKSAASQIESANLMSKQLELQFNQKNLANLASAEKILDEQAAALSTRGVKFNSPSYNAIQRETINIASKHAANLKAEQDLAQRNIELEKKNIKTSLHAQLFGDVAHLAFAGTELASKYPRKLPQVEDV